MECMLKVYFTTVFSLLYFLASESEIDHLLMRRLAFCAYRYEIKVETIALKDMHGINPIREP